MSSIGEDVGKLILNGVQAVANFYGLGGWLQQQLNKSYFGNENFSNSQLGNLLTSVINKLSTKGDQALNYLENKIGSLPQLPNYNIKSAIQEAKKRLVTKRTDQTMRNNITNTYLDSANRLMSDMDNLNWGQLSGGGYQKRIDQVKDKIIKAAENQGDNVDSIRKEIDYEKKV